MTEPAWVRIQRKTFTRWCNNFLVARDLSINVLEDDLQDGVILHHLLEILANEKFFPAPNKRAKLKLQKIENLNSDLAYIKSKDIKLVGIGAEDIHDGKSTLILGLIWTLILRFQIAGDYDDPGASAKQALLDWCNSVLNPQGLSVTNFKDSWRDGRAFCGLVNALQANEIPLDQVPASQAEKNLNRAFDTAEELFRFPKVLDAVDVIENPDELSIMTYVSYYRAYMMANTAHAPNCYAEGPGLTKATAFQPATFNVFAVNEEGQKATRGGAPIRAFLKDHNGADLCKVQIIDNRNGSYTANYSCPTPGQFELHVQVGPNHIKDSPFRPVVESGEPDPSQCTAHGPGLTNAEAGVPTHFTVETKDSHGNPLPKGGARIRAVLQDPSGNISVAIKDNNDGTYHAEYTPHTAGPLKLSVIISTDNFGEGPVQKSPFTVDVHPGKPSAANTVASGPGTQGAKAGEKAPIHVQTKDALGNNLKKGGAPVAIDVTHKKSGKKAPADVHDNGDGTYTINYSPEQAGDYDVNVTLGGEPVKDMPITVKAAPGNFDPLNFQWDGLELDANGKRIVVAGKTETFRITAKDSYGNPLTNGGLAIAGQIKGSDNVKVMVADNGDGTYEIKYTPTKIGDYQLSMSVDGKPIGGNKNPFPFTVIPGEASPQNSIAHGPGIEGGQIGKDNTFFVQSRDKFDNPLTMGGANVAGQLTQGNNAVPLAVHDNGDGTYTCNYPGVKRAGDYQLTPTLNGHPVKGAPFKVNVKAGGNALDNTTVDFPDVNMGGRPGPVVSLHDSEHNLLNKGGDHVVAEILPKSRLKSLPARDNNDGTYHVDYPPHLKGKYEVVVRVNKKEAPGGPWHVEVEQTDVDEQTKHEVAQLVPGASAVFNRLLRSATPAERQQLLAELRQVSGGAHGGQASSHAAHGGAQQGSHGAQQGSHGAALHAHHQQHHESEEEATSEESDNQSESDEQSGSEEESD